MIGKRTLWLTGVAVGGLTLASLGCCICPPTLRQAPTAAPTLPVNSLQSTPAPELTNEPPLVALEYFDSPDFGLEFWVYIINTNNGPFVDSQAQVVLYDATGAVLEEKRGMCGHVEAFSECWTVVHFDTTEVPQGYTTCNVFVEATTPSGDVREAQLSELPVVGEDGVLISRERRLPQAFINVTWNQPSGGYRLGNTIGVLADLQLLQGVLENGSACLEVVEMHQHSSGLLEPVTLAENCWPISLDSADDATENLALTFTPSGYTWVAQETLNGYFVPSAIQAHASLTLEGRLIAEAEGTLHLPPVEVVESWWEQGGSRVTHYTPGQAYSGHVRVHALASDDLPHNVVLSARYSEQDPEEWVLGGLLLFIPCLLGLCEDEVGIVDQAHTMQLVEGQDTDYTISVQTVEHPTGEVGVSGYYFFALAFEETTIWRGNSLSPSP